MIANKYTMFFEELIDFCVSIGFAKSDDFEGASKEEIDQFGKERGLEFGSGWYAFYSFFAKKINVKNITMQWGFEKVREAERSHLELIGGYAKIGVSRDWLSEIEKMVVEGHSGASGRNTNKKPRLVKSISEAAAVFFTYFEESDMLIQAYLEEEELVTKAETFCTKFRFGLYHLYYRCNEESDKFQLAPWYSYFREVKKQDPNKYLPRDRFCFLIQEKELASGRFLGIDEFEVEFIKFLIEEGITEPMTEIFDHNAPIVTYKEYL